MNGVGIFGHLSMNAVSNIETHAEIDGNGSRGNVAHLQESIDTQVNKKIWALLKFIANVKTFAHLFEAFVDFFSFSHFM